MKTKKFELIALKEACNYAIELYKCLQAGRKLTDKETTQFRYWKKQVKQIKNPKKNTK